MPCEWALRGGEGAGLTVDLTARHSGLWAFTSRRGVASCGARHCHLPPGMQSGCGGVVVSPVGDDWRSRHAVLQLSPTSGAAVLIGRLSVSVSHTFPSSPLLLLCSPQPLSPHPLPLCRYGVL